MNFFEPFRRQKFLSFTMVLLTLCVGVLIGTLLNTGVKAAKDSNAPGATPLQVPPPTQLQSSFSGLAKLLEPSVVNISSEYVPKPRTTARNGRRLPQTPDEEQQDDQGQGQGQGSMEDFMRRFFGGPSGPSPDQEQRGSSLGSGFVVDHNGYILTNNHVVERASRIRVKFNGDPTQYDARVIGTDRETDLAVIKIEKTNLTPAKIGNSDSIQVGDWAVAIGSPFGFQETVTAGIISAKSRDIPGGGSTAFQHFLQTDAAINPGNSGGPLLNINGEVIGINTQIASRSGGYQGIGFAMPINTAVSVYNQIIKAGKVTRGSIGITFGESGQSQPLLKAYNAPNGVFISKIEPGGPAEKAGLKEEDIITSIGGQRLMKSSDLIDIVAGTPVGSPLKVEYVRDGKPHTASVVVGDRMKVFASRFNGGDQQPDDSAEPEATPARFGISIQNLTDKMKENLGIKEGGVLVQSIEPGSFAEEDLQLQQGDIIVAVNRKPVPTVDEFKRIQSSLKTGDAVALRVLSNVGTPQKPDWQQRFVAGTVPAPSN